ncbi:hypothetical protein BST83_00040 [Polaribacter filamentus]|uniref:Peptidase S9 prolyl oligopeptidase catalytic domain-containing protein n=1 Tax=Polaribacter filamentus TaxID=53483 RepID=A0A2S7L2Z1_9FLAO|nr:prolyl oligopeptidase family serine peptidase [Polaribacter filamentus]PQB09098.1 hypothetical protein BST83_00040 [Polaribacter filamentus]
MTGYGAYGISDVPYLDKYMLHWLNEGGIYASAHVRGGGEKGNKWHKEVINNLFALLNFKPFLT